ncbi:TPA: hypothetical protein SAO52_002062 [Burkholderia vietnamiensis]|nr:hypothetical protein [Burkholderia vietnamiensis]HEF4837342.1 hypothetical protein [Burkholderia vietnamiensis]
MNEINGGGPAFGQVVELRCVRVEMNGDTEWEPEAMVHGGLTIRDYFAAKAAAGLMTMPDEWLRRDGDGTTWKDELAKTAYEVADAMLRARGEA